MAATWKFLLANAKDLSNIGELSQARQRSLTLTLNRSGSASFVIPMDDEMGSQIYPIQSAIKAYRFGSTGPQLVWSGFVNTIAEDVNNNRMTVSAVGWFDRLVKRILRVDKLYSNVDDAAIIQDLLAEANGGLTSGEYAVGTNTDTFSDGYVATWPLGSSPNLPSWIKWNGAVPNEGIGGATAYLPTTRNQSYTRLQTNIQQAIQALTEIENGCDWDIDPATRAMSIFRKRQRVLPGVVFGYQWGPENIAQFQRQIDGSTIANYGLATGASGTIGVYVDDNPSQSAYGPLEEVYALSDVGQQAILSAYAGAEIALKSVPRQLYSITPFVWTAGSSVPEPFVDYRIGDQVAFVARQLPRVNINQQVRVFGISVQIDEESNERLGQIQIYPGG